MNITIQTTRGPVRFHSVGEPIAGIPAQAETPATTLNPGKFATAQRRKHARRQAERDAGLRGTRNGHAGNGGPGTEQSATPAHTPTPWTIVDRLNIVGCNNGNGGRYVASVCDWSTSPTFFKAENDALKAEGKANAALIVTAVNERARLLARVAELTAERNAYKAALESSNKEAERTDRPTFTASLPFEYYFGSPALAQGGAK